MILTIMTISMPWSMEALEKVVIIFDQWVAMADLGGRPLCEGLAAEGDVWMVGEDEVEMEGDSYFVRHFVSKFETLFT